MEQLQNVYLQSDLSFDPNLIVSLPNRLIRTDKINGINAPLTLESDDFLSMQKNIAMISLIFVIVVLVQFYVGSYSHKMIGLQTIQIIQLIYFLRMLQNENSKMILSPLNSIKYSATGYSNSQLLFSNFLEFGSSQSLSQKFLAIQLKKQFLENVNFSIIILILIYVLYGIQLIRKYSLRKKFMENLDLEYKDKFTKMKRSTQWIYDHFVFPYTMLINGIVFFNSVASLKIKPNKQETQANISFPVHTCLLFLSFGIYSYEILTSYQQFIRYKTPIRERNKIPKSQIQKIEHDENNNDRPNYHPFYVFVYLTVYTLFWIFLTAGLFIESFELDFELLLGFNVVYFVAIIRWKPYHQRIKVHNYFLLLNQGTVIAFLIICITFQTLNRKNDKIFLISMYIVLLLMILVTLGGFIRIFYEFKFRKILQDQAFPLFLEDTTNQIQNNDQQQVYQQNEAHNGQRQKVQLSKKGHLLSEKNPYRFQNQLKQIRKIYRPSNNQGLLNEDGQPDNFLEDLKPQMNDFLIQKIRDQYSKKTKQLLMQSKKQPQKFLI